MFKKFGWISFTLLTQVSYPIDRPSLLTPRRDRRPRNSSGRFHEIADRWFELSFGIAYRSHGLFLTSRQISASTYAETPDHVMRVIPLSTYRYCWSPAVSDLLFAATKLATSSKEEIEAYLESAQFRETDLEDAHKAGHEVMLYCEQYISIPVGLFESTADSNPLSIILPR